MIPALIRKCIEAQARGDHEIVAWGDGSPTREFLYVEDAAEGILLATERYNSSEPVNPSFLLRTSLGNAFEISIKDLVETIARQTGFEDNIGWDTGKPNPSFNSGQTASRGASWMWAGPSSCLDLDRRWGLKRG